MTVRTAPPRHRDSHLGVRPGELDGEWYREFWNPVMAPFQPQVQQAILTGTLPAELLPGVDTAPTLLTDDHAEVENGFGIAADGSLVVACQTDMPGVTPAMWDWWFAWHGSDSRRYRLWHPRAHLFAGWADDAGDLTGTGADPRSGYVGRTSFVDEYLGASRSELAISFLPPGDLGLDESLLADPHRATAICARGGFSNVPLDAGYLVHHVRTVPGGSQMQSRFWLGGSLVAARRGGRLADPVLRRAAATVMRRTPDQAQALFVHCAQEMQHLAAFLPDLFRRAHEQGPT